MMSRLFSGDPRFRLLAGFLFLLAVLLYGWLAWLASGGDVWWHMDVVGRMVTFWGDDAYRYFEARSGFSNPQALWFSFILPVARLFDGLITFLAQGDLLYSRYIKGLLALAGCVLLFLSCRRLSVSRPVALLSVGLLALHPLYIFVGMSFYGEAWLAVLVVAALFFHVFGFTMPTLVLVGLMPLVRPEGIFFVLAFGVWHAWHRRWVPAAVPFVPGFLYLLTILAVPGLDAFLDWRFLINEVYQTSTEWIGEGGHRIVRVFYIPWVLISVAGLMLPSMRRHLVLTAPVLLLLLFFPLVTFIAEKASFEPRYLMPCLPVLALGFAVALQWGLEVARRYGRSGLSLPLMLMLALLCLQSQLRASLPIERVVNHYLEFGELPEDIKRKPLHPGSWIHGISSWGLEKNREAADVVARMTRSNEDIELVLVGNIQLFYHLVPDQLREGVGVVFVPVPAQKLVNALGNQVAGYFSFVPYGSRIRLEPAEPGTRQLLLVDSLDMPAYPLHWKVGHNDIFLFSGGFMPSEPTPGEMP